MGKYKMLIINEDIDNDKELKISQNILKYLPKDIYLNSIVDVVYREFYYRENPNIELKLFTKNDESYPKYFKKHIITTLELFSKIRYKINNIKLSYFVDDIDLYNDKNNYFMLWLDFEINPLDMSFFIKNNEKIKKSKCVLIDNILYFTYMEYIIKNNILVQEIKNVDWLVRPSNAFKMKQGKYYLLFLSEDDEIMLKLIG